MRSKHSSVGSFPSTTNLSGVAFGSQVLPWTKKRVSNSNTEDMGRKCKDYQEKGTGTGKVVGKSTVSLAVQGGLARGGCTA